MSTEFIMPKLGLTMEEGTIVEWLVPDEAEVLDGTPVLVIQTDKVETEVNVSGAGRLRQVADVGATLACGEVIGVLLADGEDAPPTARSALVTIAHAQGARDRDESEVRLLASPNARRVAAELGIDIAAVAGTGPGGRIVSEDVEEAAASRPAPAPPVAAPVPRQPAAAATATSGTIATAAARQLAELLGVDLAAVPTDARDGRTSRDDVARHVRSLLAGAAPATPKRAPSQQPSQVVALRGMRSTIATRMHASLREMAQLTLTMDADLSAVTADRDERKGSDEVVPGYTDYVIAAVGRALAEHPRLNAEVTDEGIALLPDVHVGIAVALDEGLVVPVVRHADRTGLADIAATSSRLAEAARSGSLALADLEGGTFSVSSLGMFGVDAFTPVINPPNVAILGVGRLRDDGQATLSLTWDHRVTDGAPAARFAQAIVERLAQPAALY